MPVDYLAGKWGNLRDIAVNEDGRTETSENAHYSHPYPKSSQAHRDEKQKRKQHMLRNCLSSFKAHR